jgi:G:T/U-mismatch repair DNA glycosylase
MKMKMMDKRKKIKMKNNRKMKKSLKTIKRVILIMYKKNTKINILKKIHQMGVWVIQMNFKEPKKLPVMTLKNFKKLEAMKELLPKF